MSIISVDSGRTSSQALPQQARKRSRSPASSSESREGGREDRGGGRRKQLSNVAERRLARATTTAANFQLRAHYLTTQGIKMERQSTLCRSRAMAIAIQKNSEELVAPSDTRLGCLNRFVWHPGSMKRLAWDLASMTLLAYDIVIIPFAGAFDPPETTFFTVMNWLTLVFWAADIAASMLTGFQSGNFIVLDFGGIFLHYARTWLFFDVLIVSMDLVLLSIGDSEGGSAARLGRSVRTLRFIRTLRLLRLVKLKRTFQAIHDHLNTETLSICFGITKIIIWLLVANHIVACGWYAIGIFVESDGAMNWIRHNELLGESLLYRYTTALHWSLTQFTPASMEIYPRSVYERSYAVIVLLIAMISFSSFVSILTASMAELRRIRIDESKQFWMLRRYLKDWRVSRRVSCRIQRYLEYAYRKKQQHVQESEVKLLKLLSDPLRDELKHETFSTCLSVHPLFMHCVESTRFFGNALMPISLARGDVFFSCGEIASGAIFLSSGNFEYTLGDTAATIGNLDTYDFDSNSSIAFVLEGQWVCEAVLWTSWMHLGDFQAVTECQVITIDAELFASAIRKNMPLMLAIRRYAQVFLERLNMIERAQLTDLVHTLFSPQDIFQRAGLHKSADDLEDEEEVDDVIENFRRTTAKMQRYTSRVFETTFSTSRWSRFMGSVRGLLHRQR